MLPMSEQRPTKAVILARGLGTRMRKAVDAGLSQDQAQIAATGVKAMMPVGGDQGGRPFIDYVISALADAGLTDICLVIGPEHDLVRDYYDDLPKQRVSVSFAIQEQPLGTADAVAAAEEFAGTDRFVMLNSDNYYPVEALSRLVEAPGTATLAFDARALVAKSNIPAERVAAFAILDADQDNHLRTIIEKPSPEVLAGHGSNPLVSMNCFLFGPAIFPACRSVGLSARGEYELADAIRAMLADGEVMTIVPVAEGVLDMSGRGDVPSVVAALADRTPVL